MNTPAAFIRGIVKLEDLPTTGRSQVALVGRSNVGKSSLINHLLGRKGLAKVGNTPGRTRMMNLFDSGLGYDVIDLPGYGYVQGATAHREGFASMITDYLADAPDLKLVLLVIDSRQGTTKLDIEMLRYLQQEEIPFIMIVNKTDKLKQGEVVELGRLLEEHYPEVRRIMYSTIKTNNRAEILATIAKAV